MADEKLEVKEKDDEGTGHSRNSWIFLMRQTLVFLPLCTSFFQLGLCIGSPPVVIAQLRKENITVSADQASSFSSMYNAAALPWTFLIPLFSHYMGPRLTFGIVSLITTVAFVIFCLSNSLTQLFISSAFQGVLFASEVTVAIGLITEYSSPFYRGVFQTLKTASCYWGIWVGNAIGTFFHWKKIGMLGIACGLFQLLLVFVWPESPCWLADNERYEQCRKAHRWLKGTTSQAEQELRNLLDSYKNVSSPNQHGNVSKFRQILNNVIEKRFYVPVLLSVLLLFMIQITGKFVMAMYALDILKKISGSESTAYSGMLILDGISVLGMYIGSGFSRCINRRTMYFGFAGVSLIFLFILSIYLYLIKLNVIIENTYLSMSLLTVYMISLGCGPLILASSLYGDLTPLQYRNLAMVIVGVSYEIVSSALLKISPLMFETFGLHGGFLCFAIVASIPYIVLYKYLPETKNKTLTEIESYFKSKTSLIREESPRTDFLLVPAA